MALAIKIDAVDCPIHSSNPSVSISAYGETYTKTISVQGYLLGNATQIKDAQAAMEGALDGLGDLSVVKIYNGGTIYDEITASGNYYINGSMGCRSRSFGPGNAQLVTNRFFSFSVSAEFYRTSQSDIISWNETCSMEVGGVRTVFHTILGGVYAPVKQKTVKDITRVTQTGSAVGLTSYPTFPGHIYPSGNLVYPVIKTRNSPVRSAVSGVWVNWGIGWSYEYHFASEPGFISPGKAPFA